MQDTAEKSKIPDVPSYLCRLLARGGMKEELKKYGKCSKSEIKKLVLN